MSGSHHHHRSSYPSHSSHHPSSNNAQHHSLHSHSSHHRQPPYTHSRHQGHGSPPSSSSTVGGPPALGTPGPISAEDLAFLRHQQRTLGISPAGSTSTGNGGSSNGLSLDPNALASLSNHLDTLLVAIAGRIEALSQQTLSSTQTSHRHASQIVDRATVQIENLRDILRQCDELETEFLKIKRLGEMVKGFKARIETLERRIGR